MSDSFPQPPRQSKLAAGKTSGMSSDEGTTKISSSSDRDSLSDSLPSSNQQPAADEVGFLIDAVPEIRRYSLVREIGRGGYGVVFLAYDKLLAREVAIKVARAEVVRDAAGVARFEREARAAAALEHEGIVPVFDCGANGKERFYVMPYFSEGHLGNWLGQQSEPLDERSIAQWIRQIAEAVHHGHRQGIIHRDIKPQNILLKRDLSAPYGLRPMLSDFGLCSIDDVSGESTSMMAGTPSYMSPEQAMFGKCPVAEQSDVYSLGVVCFQLLTGTTPHCPGSIPEAVLMLHSASVPSPRQFRPDISNALEAICLKCLRKAPESRYDSAQSLANDLGRLLENRPISATRERWWNKVAFAIRYGDWEPRLGWAVIAINVVTFAWAFAGAVWVGFRFPEQPNISLGFWQLLGFLCGVALPVHTLGVLAGWSMIRRTGSVRTLGIMTLGSALWTAQHWRLILSDEVPMKIYEGQEIAFIMVFLLIAISFTIQTLFLAVGFWTARSRAFQASR
ncbi:serine/threonine protein kinase [Novipirellula sp. SH528]|uniref:serine/threonine protein kinase n=1 Tax=Novipirellula sp. SH528 TaxID=3454466 RepID=UPI003FA05AB1